MSSCRLSREERRVAFAVSAMLVAVAIALLAMPYVSADSGDSEIKDFGTQDCYGYKLSFGLEEPRQAEYVIWDFGDGSDTVRVEITESNPKGRCPAHTFAAQGTYVIMASIYNHYNDSETGESVQGLTKARITCNILGYPVVTFDLNGAEGAINSIQGTQPEYIAEKPADPAYADHAFTGWYTDRECTQPFDWTIGVTRHVTLYAGWTSELHTVSFDTNGGEESIDSQEIRHGDTASEPVAPTRSGYAFSGWYNGDVRYDFNSPVESDLTLVAGWFAAGPDTVYYKVVYDAAGGKAGWSSDNILEGGKAVLPSAVRDGYEFKGWFSGDTLAGQPGDSVDVAADITYTAHWEGKDDSGFDLLLIIFIVLTIVFVLAYIFNGHYGFAVGAAVCGIVAVLIFLGVI